MSRRLLFIVAILASSFLIFLVQPMVGKRILPWFGGTPSVWTLCLAFYQTTLFVGYAYAHLLIRFASPNLQLGIHCALIGAAFVSLPVLPGEVWRSGLVTNPSVEILTMLGSSVALPFVALASTGPLVQAWFARAYPDRSPYPLYAVSNFGSFAALLAYPFLLEPRLPLSTTGSLWSYAFVAAALAVLGCAFIALRARRDEQPDEESTTLNDAARPPIAAVALWVLLSGCAVLVLMAVTNSVCLDVASVPFLWVLPLATYLMTFILSFASNTNYRPLPYVVLTLGAFFLTLGMRFPLLIGLRLVDDDVGSALTTILSSLYVQIPAYCALLFGTCMVLHGELYRLRPPARRLTAYYLCISGGGALGGLFVGILAPILFEEYYEIRVGLYMAVLLFVASNVLALETPRREALRRWPWRIATPLCLVVAAYMLLPPSVDSEIVIHRTRGFFGVLQITETGGTAAGFARQRHLLSGSTLHGVEFVDESDRSPLPTAYYGRATGIAAAFGGRGEDRKRRVGLIGLGIGTLSAYGREGDTFRYYEIDPAVVHIARDSGLFSFLDRSLADVEIVLADARLAIDTEQQESGSQAFDLLVLDAFSSDAIPVHLLTTEAFHLYVKALSDDGLLAVHVSNRHFDLAPLVARMGFAVGLQPLIVQTAAAGNFQSQPSDWILLSRDPSRLRELSQALRKRARVQKLPASHVRLRRPRPAELADVPIWTDDYSDLLGALRAE
jgi:hypothetical protein